RYSLGVPAAALVATGVALQMLKARARHLQLLLLPILSTLAVADLALHFAGYRQTPILKEAARGVNEDRLRQEMNWMFSRATIEMRDRELGEGDVWAYDESVEFLGEHWNRSSTSRAMFISSRRSVPDYLEALRRSGAKWASVGSGSSAENGLRA